MEALLKAGTDSELPGRIRPSTEIMSSNIIDPFPKEYDIPGEKAKKTIRYLDDTKKALVTNNDMVFKEGNTNMAEKKGKKN